MKGYIISIEGTDSSGKQTQTQKLFEFLVSKGKNVIKQSFPNHNSLSAGPVKMYLGGELAKTASEINAYQASTLYAVDRFCTVQKLKEHYENGGIIIFDRYVQSNMLHQAGKIKDLADRNKFLEWLDEFEFELLKLPRPDKVIFLDMPVYMSKLLAEKRGVLKAGTKQDIHEQDEQHLIDAYNSGLYVAKKFGWDIIDCLNEDKSLKTIDQIHKEICLTCFGTNETE